MVDSIATKKSSKRIIIFLVVLSCLMGFRFFMVADRSFQRDSDRYVSGMIAAGMLDFDISDSVFGMNLFCADDECFDGSGDGGEKGSTLYLLYNVQSYSGKDLKIVSTRMQQVGIQSWIAYYFGLLMGKLSVSGRNVYYIVRAFNAMLLALVIVAVCWELAKAYDFLFALSFFSVCFFSKWLTDFSTSSYWVSFLWFMPMWLGLVCQNNIKKRFILYPCFFIAVAFKSLCGYEYLSNVMLGAVIFLLSEWVSSIKYDKERAKVLLKTIVGVSISCFLGFLVALILNCYYRGDGSILAGFRDLYYSDILRRTYGSASEYEIAFADSLNSSVFDVLKLYLVFTNTGRLALLILLADSFLILIRRRSFERTRDFCFLIFGFLFSITWYVLAKSHSYIHTHINPVLFYLPYMQISFYIFIRNTLFVLFSKCSAMRICDYFQIGVSKLRDISSNHDVNGE